MKRIAFICLLIISCRLTAASQGVSFEPENWDKVKAKASAEHKFIFIDLHTEWCGPCKVLDREVFPLKEVGDFVNKNFVSLRLDGEHGLGIAFAKKYRPSGYPTFLIFDERGKLINTGTGYKPANGFLAEMAAFLKPENRTPYEGLSMELNTPFVPFYNLFFENRTKPSPGLVQDYLKKNTDWLKEENWAVLTVFSDFVPTYKKWTDDNAVALKRLYNIDIETDPRQKLYAAIIEAKGNMDTAGFEVAMKKLDSLNNITQDPLTTIRSRFDKFQFYSRMAQWTKFVKVVENEQKINGDKYNGLAVNLLL